MCNQSYNMYWQGAMLAPIRLTWHLSVLATRLRRYRCAVSQDERSNAGSCPSRLAPIRPANAAAQLVLRTQAGRKEDATASLNLSVSPTRLRRYCCAVRRDARHTVRGQPRRKALRSYRFALTADARRSIPPPIPTAPAPTRL